MCEWRWRTTCSGRGGAQTLGGSAKKLPLFCITTSPSTVMEKSSSLSASIIELLVDTRGPDEFSVCLAAMAPGAQLEVRR